MLALNSSIRTLAVVNVVVAEVNATVKVANVLLAGWVNRNHTSGLVLLPQAPVIVAVVFAAYKSPGVVVQSPLTVITWAVAQVLFRACAIVLLCKQHNRINKTRTRVKKELLILLRLEIKFISKYDLVAIAIGLGLFQGYGKIPAWSWGLNVEGYI